MIFSDFERLKNDANVANAPVLPFLANIAGFFFPWDIKTATSVPENFQKPSSQQRQGIFIACHFSWVDNNHLSAITYDGISEFSCEYKIENKFVFLTAGSIPCRTSGRHVQWIPKIPFDLIF